MISKKSLLDEIKILHAQNDLQDKLIQDLEERVNALESAVLSKLDEAIKVVAKTEKKKPGRPRKVNK